MRARRLFWPARRGIWALPYRCGGRGDFFAQWAVHFGMACCPCRIWKKRPRLPRMATTPKLGSPGAGREKRWPGRSAVGKGREKREPAGKLNGIKPKTGRRSRRCSGNSEFHLPPECPQPGRQSASTTPPPHPPKLDPRAPFSPIALECPVSARDAVLPLRIKKEEEHCEKSFSASSLSSGRRNRSFSWESGGQ